MIALPHATYRSTDTVHVVRVQIAENLGYIAEALRDKRVTSEEAARLLDDQAALIRPSEYFGD